MFLGAFLYVIRHIVLYFLIKMSYAIITFIILCPRLHVYMIFNFVRFGFSMFRNGRTTTSSSSRHMYHKNRILLRLSEQITSSCF
uniref:Uncharacterized protein n=1 Tax=Zea mays TaxID=4577 RepID=C0PHZ6_MAIZE|nr:unknown [Zea mays]